MIHVNARYFKVVASRLEINYSIKEDSLPDKKKN